MAYDINNPYFPFLIGELTLNEKTKLDDKNIHEKTLVYNWM